MAHLLRSRPSWQRRCAEPFAFEPLEARRLLDAIHWTGDGDGLYWNDPANWDLGRLPAPSDDVHIEVSGAYVSTNWGTLINEEGSFTLRDATLRTPGSLSVRGDTTISNATLLTPSGMSFGRGNVLLSNVHIDGPITLALHSTFAIEQVDFDSGASDVHFYEDAAGTVTDCTGRLRLHIASEQVTIRNNKLLSVTLESAAAEISGNTLNTEFPFELRDPHIELPFILGNTYVHVRPGIKVDGVIDGVLTYGVVDGELDRYLLTSDSVINGALTVAPGVTFNGYANVHGSLTLDHCLLGSSHIEVLDGGDVHISNTQMFDTVRIHTNPGANTSIIDSQSSDTLLLWNHVGGHTILEGLDAGDDTASHIVYEDGSTGRIADSHGAWTIEAHMPLEIQGSGVGHLIMTAQGTVLDSTLSSLEIHGHAPTVSRCTFTGEVPLHFIDPVTLEATFSGNNYQAADPIIEIEGGLQQSAVLNAFEGAVATYRSPEALLVPIDIELTVAPATKIVSGYWKIRGVLSAAGGRFGDENTAVSVLLLTGASADLTGSSFRGGSIHTNTDTHIILKGISFEDETRVSLYWCTGIVEGNHGDWRLTLWGESPEVRGNTLSSLIIKSGQNLVINNVFTSDRPLHLKGPEPFLPRLVDNTYLTDERVVLIEGDWDIPVKLGWLEGIFNTYELTYHLYADSLIVEPGVTIVVPGTLYFSAGDLIARQMTFIRTDTMRGGETSVKGGIVIQDSTIVDAGKFAFWGPSHIQNTVFAAGTELWAQGSTTGIVEGCVGDWSLVSHGAGVLVRNNQMNSAELRSGDATFTNNTVGWIALGAAKLEVANNFITDLTPLRVVDAGFDAEGVHDNVYSSSTNIIRISGDIETTATLRTVEDRFDVYEINSELDIEDEGELTVGEGVTLRVANHGRLDIDGRVEINQERLELPGADSCVEGWGHFLLTGATVIGPGMIAVRTVTITGTEFQGAVQVQLASGEVVGNSGNWSVHLGYWYAPLIENNTLTSVIVDDDSQAEVRGNVITDRMPIRLLHPSYSVTEIFAGNTYTADEPVLGIAGHAYEMPQAPVDGVLNVMEMIGDIWLGPGGSHGLPLAASMILRDRVGFEIEVEDYFVLAGGRIESLAPTGTRIVVLDEGVLSGAGGVISGPLVVEAATGATLDLGDVHFENQPTVVVAEGATAALYRTSGAWTLHLHSDSTLSVIDNDFAAAQIVLTGDANATVNLKHNWWGTMDPALIAGRITDHADDPDRPSADFSPYLDGPVATFPFVVGHEINHGRQGRGYLQRLRVDFNEAISAPPLENIRLVGATHGEIDLVELGALAGTYGDHRSYHLSLPQRQSLPDDDYVLIADSSDITDSQGNPLGGVADVDVELVRFHKLSGDVDGDRTVDVRDLGLLLASYEVEPGEPGWTTNADFDGDAAVTLIDLGMLLANFSVLLPLCARLGGDSNDRHDEHWQTQSHETASRETVAPVQVHLYAAAAAAQLNPS